jgi:DNA-binding transcriptional regulator YdaS (Cro superfamily)
MTPKQAIKHFSTQTALAAALGVTQPCISQWKKRGAIPRLQQLRIEALAGGALKAKSSILPKVSQK